MDELLPIGSVVELKNKRLRMIIGYLPNTSDDEVYDYLCCNHLRGFRKKKEDLKEQTDYTYIKKEDIETVLYLGHQDFEFTLFKATFNVDKERLLERKKKEKGE
jgi:hypothetical protein